MCLFVNGTNNAAKLILTMEILKRIGWNNGLYSEDFTIFYYNWVEDAIRSFYFKKPHGSMEGNAESFVLPFRSVGSR